MVCRCQQLLRFQRTPGRGHYEATSMGAAVYASGLPTELGMKMYGELQKAQGGVQLEGGLHLIFLILLDHPFRITGWPYWSTLFASLPRNHKEVCNLH